MTKSKLVDNLEKIAKARTEDFGIQKIQNELVNNIGALSWRLRVLAAASTYAASDRVRLADRNYEHEILESAAGGSVTEQKDTETIHGEDKREAEYASFYKSMSGDWENHSPKYMRHFPWWMPQHTTTTHNHNTQPQHTTTTHNHNTQPQHTTTQQQHNNNTTTQHNTHTHTTHTQPHNHTTTHNTQRTQQQHTILTPHTTFIGRETKTHILHTKIGDFFRQVQRGSRNSNRRTIRRRR